MQITLINHACVKLTLGGVTILCDPWLSGPAFNNGWDLLVKTPMDIDAVMDGVELPDRRAREIGDVRVMCGVSEFHDSWLHVGAGKNAILNLNDCAEGDEDELRQIARLTGPIDVLLTQFSYAAWKGGRANAHFRALAAARKLETIAAQPLRPPGESVPLERLEREFSAYRDGVFRRNSKVLIRLLRRLPLLGAFHPVTIRLTDLDRSIRVSIVDGFAVSEAGAEDVAMHSGSLSFIFNNAFGLDTLTVNGRFEATPEGFGKMTKSLAIGSLNAMGLAVSPKLVMNFKVVLMLLRRLAGVIRNMTQGSRTATGSA